MQMLKDRSFACDIYFHAAVSEEFDSLGATAGAYEYTPDMCVVVDVTHGRSGIADVGDEGKVFPLGKGPVVCRAPILSNALTSEIINMCRAKGFKPFIEVDNSDTGTDAKAIAVVKNGCDTALLSIPLKYMHTQVEIVKLDDIEATAEVLAEVTSLGHMDIERITRT